MPLSSDIAFILPTISDKSYQTKQKKNQNVKLASLSTADKPHVSDWYNRILTIFIIPKFVEFVKMY